eukprot:1861666-Amphidinium_carterae.1
MGWDGSESLCCQAPQQPPLKGVSDTALLITGTLHALNFQGFLTFWQKTLECSTEVATQYCAYAVVVQEAVVALREENGRAGQQGPSALAKGRADSEVSQEILRLYEVLMNNFIQKMGVLLEARSVQHRTLKLPDWQVLLRMSNEALDR